ncbi:mitochondrial iron ion transporter [Mycena albidolilacea]|uniref:Mitochondrial iron ion transporter n=1 Tax=Mycena albidolilacea TaxID=1033008 RepID=A0AAD7EQ95_9AGAR|nr:mitochondrial iron ion transporter [Mycena albidolilacea]
MLRGGTRLASRFSPTLIMRRSLARKPQNGQEKPPEAPEHDHEGHSHSSHSHSLFTPHSHGPGASTDTAEKLMAAFRGAGDRGSQITLLGLFANIGLLVIKGTAGWMTHSAALIADAGHSLSDLLGDGVTLVCWRLSRKPPSETYPFGFAKFETLGTTTVSLFLIGGALGVGFHSYHLLLTSLTETAATLPSGALQELLTNITTAAPVHDHAHAHGHSHAHGVDPNALWFAAIGVLSKEWLYRITRKVADQENSPVLLANAIHHRSDAYSSIVAFFAILGTWWVPGLPLDPIGGLLVALVILRQGVGLLWGAWGDLTDAGVPLSTRKDVKRALEPLLATSASPSSSPSLLAIRHVRGRRAGSLIFVDLTAEVPKTLTVHDATILEEEITQTLKTARKEVTEVRVKFTTVD